MIQKDDVTQGWHYLLAHLMYFYLDTYATGDLLISTHMYNMYYMNLRTCIYHMHALLWRLVEVGAANFLSGTHVS